MNILIQNFLADSKSTSKKSANGTKTIGNKKIQEDTDELKKMIALL